MFAWLSLPSAFAAFSLPNSPQAYLLSALYFLVLLVIFRALQSLVVMRLQRLSTHTATDIDNTVIDILRTIKPSFYVVVALYLSIRALVFPLLLVKIINAAFIIIAAYQAILTLQTLIDFLVERRAGKPGANVEGVTRFISTLAKVSLWIIGILFVLSNVGVNVISLVAGLGVGGIAVALAAQNVLGDLFSSLALYFDKPFDVGDFIVVDDVRGTVRRIGIKTTRLHSLDGEEIIIANKELTSARVKNYRRMVERRVAFNLAVTYDTPMEKLKQIPILLQDIIESVPNTRFSRAHFHKFNDSSLGFRVVYFMTIKSFRAYMDAREDINYRIKEAFEAVGIKFAFPTSTVQFTNAPAKGATPPTR